MRPTARARRVAMPTGLAALALLLAAAPAAADPNRGGDLYRRHCAVCHGPNGKPVLPNAPDFTQPTALMKPNLVLLGTVRSGRGAMPAFEGRLRDAEILDVVAYLRTLR
jgi:mono/diheme cytochrome c family protein